MKTPLHDILDYDDMYIGVVTSNMVVFNILQVVISVTLDYQVHSDGFVFLNA